MTIFKVVRLQITVIRLVYIASCIFTLNMLLFACNNIKIAILMLRLRLQTIINVDISEYYLYNISEQGAIR